MRPEAIFSRAAGAVADLSVSGSAHPLGEPERAPAVPERAAPMSDLPDRAYHSSFTPDPLEPAKGILLGVALALAFWATLLGLMLVAVPAMAGDKVTICHATGSETNLYVLISPSAIGVKAGHLDHQHNEDIIPQFTISSGPHAGTYGPQGDQSILANGCVAPSPSPSPTPTETPSPTPTHSESPKPSPPPSGSPSPTPSATPPSASPTPTSSLIPPLVVTPPAQTGGPGGGPQGLAYTGAGSILAWIIAALMAAGAGWATLRIGQRRDR